MQQDLALHCEHVNFVQCRQPALMWMCPEQHSAVKEPEQQPEPVDASASCKAVFASFALVMQ